jgi:phage-related protein
MIRKERLEVAFFETASANQSVREFLLQRTREDKRVIGADIFTVQKKFPLGLPLVEKLDTDLWEIRSHIPGGICRIFFSVYQGTIVLLHGFVKKSLKIPLKEINNPAASSGVCWFLKVVGLGFNTLRTPQGAGY